jgi:hypothetical protein
VVAFVGEEELSLIPYEAGWCHATQHA